MWYLASFRASPACCPTRSSHLHRCALGIHRSHSQCCRHNVSCWFCSWLRMLYTRKPLQVQVTVAVICGSLPADACETAAAWHSTATSERLWPVQIQGTLVASLLAAGWAASGATRLRELRRVRRRSAAVAAQPVVTRPQPLPTPDHKAIEGAFTMAEAAHKRGQTRYSTGRSETEPDASGVDASISFHRHDRAAQPRADPPANMLSAEPGARGISWPAVTIILPVKGVRPHSPEAWRSHLALQYGAAGAPGPPLRMPSCRHRAPDPQGTPCASCREPSNLTAASSRCQCFRLKDADQLQYTPKLARHLVHQVNASCAFSTNQTPCD